MGENQKILQYQWFDDQARSDKYPNATTLGRQFEIVPKTAQRSIDFMRDQLNAPLHYNPSRKGYFYTDKTFVLPASEPTQEEMLAILLAQNILENSAEGFISRQIRSFSRKLFGKNGVFGVTEKRFREAFSSSWNEYAPTQGHVFKKVMQALLDHKYLTITYTSPKDNLPLSRTVEPHHLQHYMGSWGLIAFCHVRNEWRWFMLSRMSNIEAKSESFVPKPRSQWKNQLEGGFGIFQGDELVLVRLHFNAFRAPWIREQIWHNDQKIEEVGDGSVILSFDKPKYRNCRDAMEF